MSEVTRKMEARLEALESEVATLRAQMATMARELVELKKPQDPNFLARLFGK